MHCCSSVWRGMISCWMEGARWMYYFFLKTLVWETEGSSQENPFAIIVSGNNITRNWGLNKLFENLNSVFWVQSYFSLSVTSMQYFCVVVNTLLSKMLFIYLNLLKIIVVFNQYCKEFSWILHGLILWSCLYAKDLIFIFFPQTFCLSCQDLSPPG